jgi:hypothetical protein
MARTGRGGAAVRFDQTVSVVRAGHVLPAGRPIRLEAGRCQPGLGPWAGLSPARARNRGRRDRVQAPAQVLGLAVLAHRDDHQSPPGRPGDRPLGAGLGPRSGPGRRPKPSRELADPGVLA